MSPRAREQDHDGAPAGQGPSTEPDRPIAPNEDRRSPYEPPRVLKRRSVVSATLQSPMGPTSAANTMSGN